MAINPTSNITIGEYRANTLGIISTLLHGYSGGITIVREMAQNADDVPGEDDRWLEFHFNSDALVIRNNTTFRQIDFENITNIARGGKKQEQRKTIGMFGVGFVSVYQLTDTPSIRSSGQEYTFTPEAGQFRISPSNVLDYTEFHLPYRRTRTTTGDVLGMPVVTDLALKDIQDALGDEAYRLLFFLRRLRKITMYQNGSLICSVERSVRPAAAPGEPDEVTLMRIQQHKTEHHCWLRYRGDVVIGAPQRDNGSDAKDKQVHIVIPDADVPTRVWQDLVPGRLYNYLPTEIQTGLPFQINGDFYPSTDRKHIDQDHANHREWNMSVLAGLGECLALALPSLLRRFVDEPLKLYQRLPINKSGNNLVQPIIDRFFETATTLSIFYAQQEWRKASSVCWAKDELHAIAKQVDGRIMDSELQSAAWGLIERSKVKEYTLRDFLKQVNLDLARGSKLADGPSYMQSRDQLNAIYAVLEKDFARPFQNDIASTVLFIDQSERLWTAKDCVRTETVSVLRTLRDSGIYFWDGQTDTYPRLSAAVPEFRLHHLWMILRSQIKQQIPLSSAPPWINSRTKLYALYKMILDTREQVIRGDVQGMYLCLNRQEELCTADSVFMPTNEPRLFDIFAEDRDAPLIIQSVADDRKHRGLYDDLGVGQFDWEIALKRLEKLIKSETELAQAHAIINSREKAIRIYRYLSSHREAFLPKHKALLRHQLPLWLGRDGRLHLAKDLTVPATNSDWPAFIRVESVLDIHSNENLDPFFTEVLEVKRLDTARFITQYVLPQYSMLSRQEQLVALKFLRKEMDHLRSSPELLRAVQATPLIYGNDDFLHRAGELCFPHTRLRTIFPNSFHLPHAIYAPPTENQTSWLWGAFFDLLGVHHVAPPEVVIKEVQRLTAPGMLPRDHRETIETLFRYLEEHWTPHYAGKLQKLTELRWLPAAGDDQHWYKPRELYHRTQVALVSEVAHILGFRDATRLRKDIADGLSFPSAPSRALVVNQLLKLQSAKSPASHDLYSFLINATDHDLKPLIDQPIIWDKQKEVYWKASSIFLENHKHEFGAYRGYMTSGDLRSLLERLGAKTNPTEQDYCDLIMEIAQKYRTQAVPSEEMRLLTNAYSHLTNADPNRLEKLKAIPCILSRIGEEHPQLCLPSHVLLQPIERLIQLFPRIPIAVYNPGGETTLRQLGVRSHDQVLEVEFRLQPALTRPFQWLSKISLLERALRRLFHHYSMLTRAEVTIQGFRDIKAFYEEAIQLVYHITLAGERISSSVINEKAFYDRNLKHIYIQAHLDEGNTRKALARALDQILNLPIMLVLLEKLLEDPRNWQEILDDNRIKPMPPQFDFEASLDMVEDLQLGEESHRSIAVDDLTPPVALERAEKILTTIVKTNSAEDSSKGSAEPNTVPQPHAGIHSPMEPATAPSTPRQTALKKIQGPLASVGTQSISPEPSTKSQLNGGSPLPSVPANIPAFKGRSTLSSPSILTDLDGLRERVRGHFAAQNINIDVSQPPIVLPPQLRWQSILPTEPTEAHTARFILSFAEVSQGFLRLHREARNLFLDKPAMVRCCTDIGHAFELYFNWTRTTPIVYNEIALTSFFAEQIIPAGGIVYLERLHGHEYRLYYNYAPHTVCEVRIALNEQGVITYETIDKVTVACETDEAIYRAEKRHEDQVALWIEAVGKKSVEETLCDLLLSAPDGWLHEADLKAIVNAERMVAASTVEQTLRKKSWFVTDGQGSWSLDPKAVLSTESTIAQRWSKLSTTLINSPDSELLVSMESLLSMLQQIRQRLIALEPQTPALPVNDQPEDKLDFLNSDPYNKLAIHSLEQDISQRIHDPDVELLTDPMIRNWFRSASEDVWHLIIRPLLTKEIELLKAKDYYQRAADLAQCWADFDPNHGQSLKELTNEASVWSSTRGKPAIADLIHAIERAPKLIKLREELHIALQSTLLRHTKEDWMNQSDVNKAMQAFFKHIRTYDSARTYLARDHQTAYDRTIELQAHQLSEKIEDQKARVRLALELSTIIQSSIAQSHLRDLADYVSRADIRSIETMLLASRAWTLCSPIEYLRKDIANTLAHCHIYHRIWELANNQSWKGCVSNVIKQQLEKGWEQHRSSQLSREQSFLDVLNQLQLLEFASLLENELLSLQLKVERDIKALIASSAG